jgi:hypothetical protein
MKSRILQVCFVLAVLLVFSSRAQAQFVSYTLAAQHHGSALNLPVGWTELQDTFSVSIAGGCTTGTTACSFNVLPTTAGSVWVIVESTSNQTHITSASSTGGGGTWTTCPAGGSFAELCNVFNSSTGAVDAIYNLGGAAGTETVAVTINTNAAATGTITTGFYEAAFIELLPPPGQTASFDTAGATASTACTTCTGVALNTSATDVVLQFADNFGSATSSNPCSSPYITDAFNQCIGLNIASGSLAAPTFTQTPSSPMAFSALAFKSSAANFTTSTPLFSLVHYTFVSGAGGLICTPTCSSVTIPSTTAGNLLFIASASVVGSDALVSFTDGGDTSTACSGANITVTGQAESMSCGYTITAGGKTSVTPVMSTTGNTGFGIYELARTGGSWTLDAQGSTQRAASPPYITGQTLSLTGTNDACFQGAYNAGGTSTATQYLTPYTFGASGGVYILNTEASEQILLGTYYGSLAGTGGAPVWLSNANSAGVNGVCFH